MPKDNTPSNPMHQEEIRMLLHRMIEQSTKTGETTSSIHLTVQELRQLLALLARPEGQELALGQSLEQALIRMLERLEGIELSQSHLVRSQKASDDQLAEIMTTQKALDNRLSQLEAGQATILASRETIAGMAQAMQRMEAGQEQLKSDLSQYFADPFPEEDLPGQ